MSENKGTIWKKFLCWCSPIWQKFLCWCFGHVWTDWLGGYHIDTSNGHSICYRCGHSENRGDDPATWFPDPRL